MTPFKFEEADRVLGAGENPNTRDMHVVTAMDPELDGTGRGIIVSCWEPNAEELAEFLKTKRVYIGVMCHLSHPTQPPVCVMAFNPFEHYGYKAIQFRRGGQRMFEGKVNIMDLAFDKEGRTFAITVSGGENSFTLEEVCEIKEDSGEPVAFLNDTKEYFWAWEILSAKYKEI